jgi:tRNA modification GTPase
VISRGADLDGTIVALSSATGPGLRAIVRLSGPAAGRIVRAVVPEFAVDPFVRRQIFAGHAQLLGERRGLSPPETRSDCTFPVVINPTARQAGSLALPVDVLFFHGPKTYTGQDVAELHTISSPPLIDALLQALLAAGARAALPGEFTMRAFLAGKLDLTRAEAVHAVIEAESPTQLRTALAQLAGNLSQPLDAVRSDLLDLLAEVEAGLDFSEEDLAFAEPTVLLGRLTAALAQVTLAKKRIESRTTHDRPIRAVLVGPPNAGKSSLFNKLLGRPAALVHAEPGTTRDYLEADLALGGRAIRLVDTAGLQPALSEIDADAQAVGRRVAADAEIVIACRERGQGEAPPGAIAVGTKADLGPVEAGWLAVSAATGAGLDALRSKLVQRCEALSGDPSLASLSRCRHHVDACLEHLRHGHAVVVRQEPAELLALQLRLALDELGAIVGAVYTDDLLDRIFSKFCIGK